MFSRSKLRQILTKHQKEFKKNVSENLRSHKNDNAAKNHNKNNNITGSEYMAWQQQDKSAHGDGKAHLGGSNKRATPTHYFTSKADEQLKSAKSSGNKNNNNGNEHGQGQENALSDQDMDIFHRAVSPILILGQCFALMPVRGVQLPNPRHMRFSFKSLQMVITLMFSTSNFLLLFALTTHLIGIGINPKNIVGVIFFGSVQFACILFLSLASRWPRMLRCWTRTELVFTRQPYETPKRNLAVRVRTAAAIIIILSMVEHGFFLCSAILSYIRQQEMCAPILNTTVKVSFERYMNRNYDYVFALVPYNSLTGIYILIINVACTFIWNYMDLFIIIISKGIAYRFEQITARINKLADKEVPESTFAEIREHYVKMCDLLDNIDENISGLILLSCMNNLYFVCGQLLNIFNKLRWPINYIYFWYSLLYLIGRTAFVFLTAASINDESKGAVGVLRRVSSKTWCVEVERLIFQMTRQTVALSGKKFFFLTRSLLFGMAGTIVTYELVLLQFDEPNRSKGLPNPCA